jgi:predicted nuclease of predicted toxin-antitoxin system
MKFKLDENLPIEISNILKEEGHSDLTVLDKEGKGEKA